LRTDAPLASGSSAEEAAELRQLMLEALARHETAATPLGSFPAVFAPQLALGTLSRRRVYADAQQARVAACRALTLVMLPYSCYPYYPSHVTLVILPQSC